MDISSSIGSYYQIKSITASQNANVAILKTTMNNEKQQMNDLLRCLPAVQPNLGKNIDIKI